MIYRCECCRKHNKGTNNRQERLLMICEEELSANNKNKKEHEKKLGKLAAIKLRRWQMIKEMRRPAQEGSKKTSYREEVRRQDRPQRGSEKTRQATERKMILE